MALSVRCRREDFTALQLPCWKMFPRQERRRLLLRMLERGDKCAHLKLWTALRCRLPPAGWRSRITYEERAAIELEALAEQAATANYPFRRGVR